MRLILNTFHSQRATDILPKTACMLLCWKKCLLTAPAFQIFSELAMSFKIYYPAGI